MKSLKEQSQSTDLNNAVFITGHPLLKKLSEIILCSVGLKSKEVLFLREIISRVQFMDLSIITIKGIPMRSDIDYDATLNVITSEIRKKVFENLLFQDEIEKENFYKIAVHLNEKYLIESASLNTTNENITIHGYQINGPTFASLLEEIVIINLKT